MDAAAPLTFPGHRLPVKVALFKGWRGSAVDPSVTAALDQAAKWLQHAGYTVDLAEPPHFEEAAVLHRQMAINDLQRAGIPAMMRMGDAAMRQSLTHYMTGVARWDNDQCLEAQVRRFNIARDWAVFLERFPLLLMPNS